MSLSVSRSHEHWEGPSSDALTCSYESYSQDRQQSYSCLPSDWQNNQQPQHHIGLYQLSTIVVTGHSGLLRSCILMNFQVIYLLCVTQEKPSFRLPLCLPSGTLKTRTLTNLLWEHSTSICRCFRSFLCFIWRCVDLSASFSPRVAKQKTIEVYNCIIQWTKYWILLSISLL